MLPDYPELKEAVSNNLTKRLRAKVQEFGGLVSQFATVRIFEGHRTAMERPSGETEQNEFFELGSTLSLATKDIPTLTINQLCERIDSAARELADQRSKKVFAHMASVVEKAGNALDHSGRPFSPETYLEALERMEIAFPKDGEPRLTLAIHPSLQEKAIAAIKAIDDSPELNARRADIMDRKREAWNAREASRKLVG